ncbi:MAG TPA: hypothetical protein VEC37_10675 [Bacillota bacterium]|nr:hypothetical protein [Bacillota bacterium]
MRKRINLPGQLSFNFDCSYLKWIDSRSEQFESFQEATQKILTSQEYEKVSSPIWQEIVCALNH